MSVREEDLLSQKTVFFISSYNYTDGSDIIRPTESSKVRITINLCIRDRRCLSKASGFTIENNYSIL